MIIKIMRAADAGLISLPDRDRRIDNVRRSGSDVGVQFIGAELDRLFATHLDQRTLQLPSRPSTATCAP
ncbi:MAG: hypothetical protein R2709_12860 [Marmoricola sp.]